MIDLTNRVVIVTGGNGGVGLAIAEAVGRAGADVMIWGRNPQKNAAASKKLASIAHRTLAVECDVTDERAVTDAFAATVDEMGHVDSLFANAGIARWSNTPFQDLSLEHWQEMQRTNLEGAFLCLRAMVRYLLQEGREGALVGVASLAALSGAARASDYAASKAGVVAMMRSLAVELASKGIRSNTLVLGWTDTEMNAPVRDRLMEATAARTPIGRWLQPSEIAPLAVLLADPSMQGHIGDTMVLDGGFSLS